jgi:protocatechuate 3,4-dioxygenase beta subunit
MSSRRSLLKGASVAAAALLMRGQSSASTRLTPTPFLGAGPFYPRDPSGLPLLSTEISIPDPLTNDLTQNGGKGRAKGRHIHVSGRVLDTTGRPLAGAIVEIWSVNASNIYHVQDAGASDPNFAGFGATKTDASGRYSFKTIRPQGYDRYLGLIRRTAHIHFLVKAAGGEVFTTEMWFADEPRNSIDALFRRITDSGLRSRMAVVLSRNNGVDRGRFDLVLAPQYAGRV